MLKMNVNSVKTKDYENKRRCGLRENKPKTNPIKPNFNRGLSKYFEVFVVTNEKNKYNSTKINSNQIN